MSTQKEDWQVWIIVAGGVIIAPVTLWLAARYGLHQLYLSRLEYLLFTVGMLGVSLCHFFVNRYKRKLKNYHIPYEYFVPGAYGLTRIQQTYKYQEELFSPRDKSNHKWLQFFSYLGIFFLSLLAGFGMVLLYSTYIRP